MRRSERVSTSFGFLGVGLFCLAFADLSVVRVAVNQEYVTLDHPVTAEDEVALFPPVTGG